MRDEAGAGEKIVSSGEHTKRGDEGRPCANPERSSYDVLDVQPGASREEVEAAYRRALRIIDGNSLGGYLMLEPDARESARREVEQAFEALTKGQAGRDVDSEPGRAEAAGQRPVPSRETHGGEASEKGGRRSRRRRRRKAARRSREQPSEAPIPASTVPPARADDEGATQPAIPLKPPAAVAPRAADAPDERSRNRSTPAAAKKDAPERMPKAPTRPAKKKPLLRFLSPVLEASPESPPSSRASQPPTRPPVSASQPPTRPSVSASQPPTRPPVSASQPPTSRRPWLYSDVGTESVTEPRVIARGEDPDEENLTLPPESEINGGVIRRLREARGITLEELSEQTHIRKAFLLAIEEQDLEELPASVYLRGFLTQIARVLKVDKKHLADGYMSFVGRFRK